MIDYAVVVYCIVVYGYSCCKGFDTRNSVPARICWFIFAVISLYISLKLAWETTL